MRRLRPPYRSPTLEPNTRRHPICKHFGLVSSDDDDRASLQLLSNDCQQPRDPRFVEPSRRLIEQNRGRPMQQCARQRYPLPLPAGVRPQWAVCELTEVEPLPGQIPRLRCMETLDPRSELDVLPPRQVRVCQRLVGDPAQLRALIEAEKPHLVVPEIEAIATPVLEELEAAGVVRVIPTARAARLTMDREGIRRLAAETLGLPTSPYRFCDSLVELQTAIDDGIGYPCVVKPVMSSSGKGQSKIDGPDDVAAAWDYAMAGGRVSHGRVIVEGFIDFDYEITLLTVRAAGQGAQLGEVVTHFCEPIGHKQVSGDYVESWQPQPMSPVALQRAREIAPRAPK